MFSHKLSKGFEDAYTYPVSEVNGTRIRDLKHLVELLRDARGDLAAWNSRSRVDSPTRSCSIASGPSQQPKVLNDNGIRQQCSSDMAKV